MMSLNMELEIDTYNESHELAQAMNHLISSQNGAGSMWEPGFDLHVYFSIS